MLNVLVVIQLHWIFCSFVKYLLSSKSVISLNTKIFLWLLPWLCSSRDILTSFLIMAMPALIILSGCFQTIMESPENLLKLLKLFFFYLTTSLIYENQVNLVDKCFRNCEVMESTHISRKCRKMILFSKL